MQAPQHARLIIFGILAVLLGVNILVYSAVFSPNTLMVAVLDVGQGDAILVRGPTGVTMLVDSGPDRGVLRELGAVLPFGDRTIDAVIATHTDKDHIGGLPDVFQTYEVAYFFEPGVINDSTPTKALMAAVGEEAGLTHLLARRGTRFDLGGGAHADILFPDRDVSKVEINDASIVMKITYGATSFLLTGDLASKTEEWLVTLDGAYLDSDVLKVGHHGSKTSTSDTFLEAVTPAVAAISVGAKNSYGHPTPDVLARLTARDAEIKRTDLSGRLVFFSDGVTIR